MSRPPPSSVWPLHEAPQIECNCLPRLRRQKLKPAKRCRCEMLYLALGQLMLHAPPEPAPLLLCGGESTSPSYPLAILEEQVPDPGCQRNVCSTASTAPTAAKQLTGMVPWPRSGMPAARSPTGIQASRTLRRPVSCKSSHAPSRHRACGPTLNPKEREGCSETAPGEAVRC